MFAVVYFPLEQLQETLRTIHPGRLATTVFDLEEGGKAVKALVVRPAEETLGFTLEAIKMVRAELDPRAPVTAGSTQNNPAKAHSPEILISMR